MNADKRQKNETAQEEFARRVRELYALAGKMGLRLSITVKAQPREHFAKNAQCEHFPKNAQREPGEN